MMGKKFYRDPKDRNIGWIPWSKDTGRASWYRIEDKPGKFTWWGPMGAMRAPDWLRKLLGWE